MNSTNLCKANNRAISEFTGQNGKLYNTNPVLKAKCGGKGKKKGKHGGGRTTADERLTKTSAEQPKTAAAFPAAASTQQGLDEVFTAFSLGRRSEATRTARAPSLTVPGPSLLAVEVDRPE